MVSYILLFSLLAYSAGIFFAFIRKSENGRRLRGIIPLLIGICLASVAYSASATAQYGSAAFLFIVFYGLAIPLSIFGIGALLTSAGSFLPSTILGNCVKIGLVATPIFLVAFVQYEANQRRDARQQLAVEQQALFQMTDVEGTLSGLPVVLPVSPQIDLYHNCANMGPRSRYTCRTFFWKAVRLRVEDQLTTPVPFKEILINPTDSATQAWCKRRPNMESRVWCNDIWEHKIRLTETPFRTPHKNSTEVPDTPDNLRIFCQEGSKGYVCQSYYVVAPDVFVRGWFDNVDLGMIVPIAVDLQRVSDLIWQDIARQH